jgi:hypothetical protein
MPKPVQDKMDQAVDAADGAMREHGAMMEQGATDFVNSMHDAHCWDGC